MAVLALVVMTALALGQTGTLMSSAGRPGGTISLPEDNSEAVTRAFYDGMNRYLATGDDRFVNLLAPGFQDFQTTGRPGDSATLLARLDAMRSGVPTPHYSIEVLHSLGTMVEVRISTGTPGVLDAAGLTMTMHPVPAQIEYLKLQRDAIVARWSRDDLIPLIEPGLDTRFAPVVRSVAVAGIAFAALALGIELITLAPGAGIDIPGREHYVLIVATGTVAIETSDAGERLSAGERQFISTRQKGRIANPEPTAATFWLVSLENTGGLPIGRVDDSAASAGIVARWLVWSPEHPLPSGTESLRLQVVRVTLPVGSELSGHRSGLGEAIAVLDGALEATVFAGSAVRTSETGVTILTEGGMTLVADQGISASNDTVISYRVSGSIPATLLVLTVVPGD